MADKEQRRDYKSSMCLYALLLSIFAGAAAAAGGTVVTSLPGYAGDLPFTLETGYVGVGETDEVQLFYYFVESQRSPSQDPLILWLAGGPGCSDLVSFFFESGPVSFTYVGYNGSLPQLHDNPFAWTQGLNILYVDQPVGTGFSYSTTQEGYVTDDLTSASDTHQFLRKVCAHYKENKNVKLDIQPCIESNNNQKIDGSDGFGIYPFEDQYLIWRDGLAGVHRCAK